MSLFQLNRHHSENCGAGGSECSSAVVIVKLSIKTELFDKAIEFIKDRIIETRAFEGCQKCEVAASKEESDIIVYEIWDTFDDQKKYVEWRTETGVLEETLEFMDSEPRFFQYDHIGSY
jgi:quinol monooxygenase YgiN